MTTTYTTVPIPCSRYWSGYGPGNAGFPDAARAYLNRMIALGWTHGPGWVQTPAGDRRDECGCPDCAPDAYGCP